jgi:hypothetical protein
MHLDLSIEAGGTATFNFNSDRDEAQQTGAAFPGGA